MNRYDCLLRVTFLLIFFPLPTMYRELRREVIMLACSFGNKHCHQQASTLISDWISSNRNRWVGACPVLPVALHDVSDRGGHIPLVSRRKARQENYTAALCLSFTVCEAAAWELHPTHPGKVTSGFRLTYFVDILVLHIWEVSACIKSGSFS